MAAHREPVNATSAVRAVLLTTAAMVAFAGNSILCRLALQDGAIDPASFTAIRLASGAAALAVALLVIRRPAAPGRHGSWFSALMLFAYAACFSYAYVTLDAGTGALILFGLVQATMIAIGMFRGDRPGGLEWLGWLVAVAGLVWLLLPGVAAPPVTGAGLMAAAGIAWGVYSIRGRGESNPLAATARNFVLSLAFVSLLAAFTIPGAELGARGALLAAVSGALTSGAGYVIWYAALDCLSAMQAALVQLSVPVIAAIGGIVLLAEPLTLRLAGATVLVLGGISLALVRRSARA